MYFIGFAFPSLCREGLGVGLIFLPKTFGGLAFFFNFAPIANLYSYSYMKPTLITISTPVLQRNCNPFATLSLYLLFNLTLICNV